MLPLSIRSEIQRIESRIDAIDQLVNGVDPIIQGIFSSQIVLSGAGMVEKSVINVLGEYGRQKGDLRLSRYVQKTISRNNSLNCEKIEKILQHFDADWWPVLKAKVGEDETLAVDSLKTLRDSIAHGGQCGTGYSTVKGYYCKSKLFVSKMSEVILGKDY